MKRAILAAAIGLLAACGSPAADPAPAPEQPNSQAVTTGATPGEATHPVPEPTPPAPPPPEPLAAPLVRAEHARSERSAECAPLALTSDGGAPAKARRANFSDGWGVAFDTPAVRSAYGVAGVGTLPTDGDPAAVQEQRLRAQWPYFTALPDLPQPAFAGYGVEGAEPYPADNPDGGGLPSLAYVRVGGQACDYNVWSRLGRAHLEALLMSLRML